MEMEKYCSELRTNGKQARCVNQYFFYVAPFAVFDCAFEVLSGIGMEWNAMDGNGNTANDVWVAFQKGPWKIKGKRAIL